MEWQIQYSFMFRVSSSNNKTVISAFTPVYFDGIYFIHQYYFIFAFLNDDSVKTNCYVFFLETKNMHMCSLETHL